jgi:EmrB/QacA subfamily drug resistance transporter
VGWVRDRLLVEPARPRRVAESPRAAWLTVATVSVGAFMGQLDASIVNVAYPSIQQAFHASLGAVQWVGLAYLSVLIATVAAVGRVADMLGRKLLYTYGFLVFGIGSALCAVAPTLVVLDACRVLQAVGAVMLQANSVAIIAASLSRRGLGRGIGAQGTAQALGLGFGPLVGGFLIGLDGWRLIFLVNVPVSILGVTTAWLFVPRTRGLGAHEPFDWPGLAAFVPALLGLLLALSFGDQRGWGSPEVLSLLTLAVVAGAAFTLRERRTPHPLIHLGLFRRRRFSIGVVSSLLSFLVLFGVLFVTPFSLERGHGDSVASVGLIVSVLPLAMAATAPLSGRAADRIGARAPTGAGMLLAAAGCLIAVIRPGGLAGLAGGLALCGAGIGLFTPANSAAMMASVPARRVGVSSGVINLTRGLGTALGLSLTALVYARGTGGATTPAAVGRGFRDALVVLACASIVAASLALLRRPFAEERTPG